MEAVLDVVFTLSSIATQWVRVLSCDKSTLIQIIKSGNRLSVYGNGIKSHGGFIPCMGVSSVVRSSILYLSRFLLNRQQSSKIHFLHWLDHLNSKAICEKCRFTMMNLSIIFVLLWFSSQLNHWYKHYYGSNTWAIKSILGNITMYFHLCDSLIQWDLVNVLLHQRNKSTGR